MTRATRTPTSAAVHSRSTNPGATAASNIVGTTPQHLSLSIDRVRLSLPAGMATPAWIDGFSAALPRAIESRLTELMSGSTASSPISAPRAPISGVQAAAWVADQLAALAADHIADAAGAHAGGGA